MNNHFVYLSEVDISVDNGRGINEREFVRALLDDHAASVTCILPEPEFPERFRDERIEYVRGHGGAPIRYGLHLLASYRRLRALHARRPVSCLVTRLEVVPVVPFLALKLLHIPVVLKTLAVYGVFAGTDRTFRSHRLASRSMARAFRATIEGCLVADTVGVAMAEWTRSRFRLAPEQLVVIPNGANTTMFTPGDRELARAALGLDRFETVIGYVGILGPDRGLDLLVEELGSLREEGLAVGLLLVGSGPSRDHLERLVKDKGLERYVVFTGQVAYDDVPEIMRALDVGIDLSLLYLQTEDGREIPASFSQKLGQYLASAVPVVAWDLPDTQFVAEHDVGRLVDPADPAEVRRAVAELVRTSRDERVRLRARCRETAERELAVHRLVHERVGLWRERVRNGEGTGP